MSTGNSDEIELSRVRGAGISEPLDATMHDNSINENNDIMVRSGISEAIDPKKKRTFTFEPDSDGVDGVNNAENVKTADIADIAAESTVRSADSDDKPPDGGFKAYSVLVGSYFTILTNLGLINSVGAIQTYVSEHQLAGINAISVSWIFSIYLCLAYGVGLVTGSIFDRKGPTGLLVVSAVLIVAGLFGAAYSKTVYQFILSFMAVGISNGLSLTPSVGVINHWFSNKKIGAIQGLSTSAGSLGGLAFPLLLRFLYPNYGFSIALIVLGCICLGCMLIGIALIRERVKRQSKEEASLSDARPEALSKWKKVKKESKVLSFKHLKDTKYVLLIIGAFFAELSLVLIVTYYATYAIAQGVSESTAYILLTVWNATGILGRFLPGLGSDFFGKFNTNILMLLGYNISIFALWVPFGYDLKVLYAFAALGGFFLGLILSMVPICLSQISLVVEFGERYGLLNFFLSLGNLFGVPIAAVIIGNGSVHNYKMFSILVCICSVIGTLFWYLSRHSIVGFRLNVKI
mmetsp:Transcript_6961/g.6927  ORF Transcript_6961/g.6927 Transcript_6961/m.6927 type:complete len:519 (-) Transcript_6961:141-1697(-)